MPADRALAAQLHQARLAALDKPCYFRGTDRCTGPTVGFVERFLDLRQIPVCEQHAEVGRRHPPHPHPH